VITEARWIKEYLESRFAAEVALAPNGVRKDIYCLEGRRKSPRVDGKLRVLVEGALGVFFKNVDKAIELAKKSNADEVWLLTPTPSVSQYEGVDRVFSAVTIQETAEIYRACDVLLKLSYVEGMFGPPLEMFHCGGTSIVYDVTGHDEYIENDLNALVVQTDDEIGVINALNKLKSDRGLLKRLCEGGVLTARNWPAWNDASPIFLSALEQIVDRPQVNLVQSLRLQARLFEKWFPIQVELEQSRNARSLQVDSLKVQIIEQSTRINELEQEAGAANREIDNQNSQLAFFKEQLGAHATRLKEVSSYLVETERENNLNKQFSARLTALEQNRCYRYIKKLRLLP
jgi:glycosyltransferase involved in cell wall biosynthesis